MLTEIEPSASLTASTEIDANFDSNSSSFVQAKIVAFTASCCDLYFCGLVFSHRDMLWHKSYPRLTTGGAACWQASSGKRF